MIQGIEGNLFDVFILIAESFGRTITGNGTRDTFVSATIDTGFISILNPIVTGLAGTVVHGSQRIIIMASWIGTAHDFRACRTVGAATIYASLIPILNPICARGTCCRLQKDRIVLNFSIRKRAARTGC